MSDLPVVLLAFANNYREERFLVNLAKERDEIIEILRTAKDKALCDYEIIEDADIKKVAKAFNYWRINGRVAIFHFAGHANDYQLCFNSFKGEPEYINAEGFAQFLGEQDDLKLVFLNGCATQDHAIHLHEKGIPAVISTKREVNDTLAADMAIEFYRSLSTDKTIWSAFQEAEGIVKSKNDQWSVFSRGLGFKKDEQRNNDWGLTSFPNEIEPSAWCFSNAKNDPLYGLPRVERSIKPIDPFIGLNEYLTENCSVFWGRDQEIKKLFDILDKIAAPSLVFCHGVKGVGKSSLLKAGVIPRLSKKYNVITHDIGNKLPTAEFKKQFLFSLLNNQSKETKTFIFIFGLTEINETHLAEIISVNDGEDHEICFVIETPNHLLQKWNDKFKKHTTCEYHLRPLNKENIDNIFLKLDSNYVIVIEKEFQENFSSIVLSDSRSAIAPMVQFILSELWQIAKEKNFEKPHFNLELLTEWNENGGFTNYINLQLAKIDEVFLNSGLVLEILNACAPSNNLSSIPDIYYLNNLFNIPLEELEKIIFQLKNCYLISEPVAPEGSSFNKFRLYHSILISPLKDILDNSFRPAQEVRRICKSLIRSKGLFSKKQLKLIRLNWDWVKTFKGQEQTIYEDSKQYYQTLDKNKSSIKRFQIVLCLMILVGGIFFTNPYLLMFMILVFVLYVF